MYTVVSKQKYYIIILLCTMDLFDIFTIDVILKEGEERSVKYHKCNIHV